MKTISRLTLLATALVASNAVWAATGNVDVYGQLTMPVAPLPTHQTYSAASTLGDNFFSTTPSFVPQTDITTVSNATAQISGTGYAATARTTQGSNHAYTSVATFPSGGFSVASFSGWYDQVAITGGTGTGTVQFSVQLNGVVDAGAFTGGAVYGLFASTLHPTQLVDSLNIIDTTTLPTHPWALDAPVGFGDTPQVATITSYVVGVSPYNDTEILFPSEPHVLPGIPSIEDPSKLLGGELFAPVVTDLILTPGANQAVNVTLTGTLEFTYGEAFYLIGALGTEMYDGLDAFCTFAIGDCTPTSKDGTGPTTLDFANSAHLVGIVLPAGASFSSASGAAYNVTAVPEPSEWLMLLAGLGLVGWRAARRRA